MKQIFTILVLSSLVISCSKNKEEKALTKTDLLTASTWYKIASTLQVPGGTNELPGAGFDMCAKDDPYNFTSDGNLQINQGNLRCTGQADYTYHYNWQFKDNETILSMNSDPLKDWQIVELTQESLVIRQINASGLLTRYFAHK